MRSTDADEVLRAHHLPHHIPVAVYEERAEAASLSDALLQCTSGGHRRTQAHLRAAHVEVDRVTPPIDVESRLHERLGVVRTELRNERLVLYAVSDALLAARGATNLRRGGEVDGAIRCALMEALAVQHRGVTQVRVVLACEHTPRQNAVVDLKAHYAM